MKWTTPRLLALYGAGASWLLWPAIASFGRLVPGAERSDLWESLWSLWYVRESLAAWRIPLRTVLLGFPDGGSLAVADPLNALAGLPLVQALGLPGAYVALVWGQLVLAGWAAHRLVDEVLGRRAFAACLAGLAYQGNAVVVSALHDGTSEAVGGGWLPLALLLALHALRRGGPGRAVAAGVALGITTVACWYYGLAAFVAVAALAALGEGSVPARDRWVRLGPALLLGAALCAPCAMFQVAASTAQDNLVGIKGLAELAILRRTTGAVDPLSFLLPWDFRSPDFRVLSRYGEDFVHCPYLGWTLLLGAAVALARGRARPDVVWLVAAAGVLAALSLGPVLVHGGSAVLLPGDRAIPLPYLALEWLPGFDRLSLLFRVTLLPALAVAVLAAVAVAGFERHGGVLVVAVVALAVAEQRLLSPVRGLPAFSDASSSAPLRALAAAPDGALMNAPVVGGRRYLFEQTFHRKPLAGSLNFPENEASLRIWRAVASAAWRAGDGSGAFAAQVAATACPLGVRYLAIHDDPVARPDWHTALTRAVEAEWTPLLAVPGVRVYDLCPGAQAAPRGG